MGGSVNSINIRNKGLKGSAGIFFPDSKNIYLNQRSANGRGGANAAIHEILHAGFKGLNKASFSDQKSSHVFDNLRRAYDNTRKRGKGLTYGRGVGLGDLSGYPKNQYFEENVVQSGAEALLPHRSLGIDKKNNTLYRYVRKLIGKGLKTGAADGFVPNLVGERLGSGAYGSFYKLKGNIGTKRFHDPSNKKVVAEELAVSEFLSSRSLPSHIKIPRRFGSLKRSVEKGRIGKEVVTDPVGENSFSNDENRVLGNDVLSSIISEEVYKKGISLIDIHGENFTIGRKSARVFDKYLSKLHDSTGKTRKTDRYSGAYGKISKFGTARLAKFAEKVLNKNKESINLIDLGFGQPTKEAKGPLDAIKAFIGNYSDGYVPNLASTRGKFLDSGITSTGFYDLSGTDKKGGVKRGGVGIKRYKPQVSPSIIKDEYLASKLFNKGSLLPGVTGPKVFGSLKRSLKSRRIGKQVIEDPSLLSLAFGGKMKFEDIDTVQRVLET